MVRHGVGGGLDQNMGHTKDDEAGAHDGGHGTAADGLEGQEDAGNESNAAESREQAHGDVGNARLEVILANLLEVKVAIEASEPAGKSNEHLGERGVDVHEEATLDVLGSEATKATRCCG